MDDSTASTCAPSSVTSSTPRPPTMDAQAPGEFKCTFSGCDKTWDSLKEMKQHKKYSVEHDYCKICDIDFDDWTTWVMHMSQRSGQDWRGKTVEDYNREKEDGTFEHNKFLVGESYGQLKHHHYYCKFCGIKYRTASARTVHTTKSHKAEQNVVCPGCDEVFPRAAGLIFHLEENHCSAISGGEFIGYLQHKAIISMLLQDSSLLEELSQNDYNGYQKAATDEEKDGGVRLANEEKPPAPKNQPQDAVAKSIGTPDVNLRSSAACVDDYPLSEDASLRARASSAWGTRTSSELLFPGAESTPVTEEWKVQHVRQEKSVNNILTHQFWNPKSPDYDPKRFYDPIIEKHRCRFPGCDKSFDFDSECEEHIGTTHAVQRITCPACTKAFPKWYALVAHVESSTKCNLPHNSKFGVILDRISGGFLKASIEKHPGFDVQEDGYAVGYVKYEGTKPGGFIEQPKTTTIGVNTGRHVTRDMAISSRPKW